MADIRIKDLATTASSAASDDFMALDGATNGTRKMSAANPSVTTLTTSGVIAPGGSVHGANGSAANPSFAFLSDQDTGLYRIGANNIGVAANGAKVLDIATTGLTVTGALGASSLTSPAATDLTLGTGSYGTALTVASATGNVGIGATPSAWGGPNIPALDIGAYGAIYSATGVIGVGTSANCYYNGTNWIYKSSQYATVYYHGGGNHVWLNSATGVGGNTVSFTQAMTLGPTGTLSIASTTAGASNAGALVVQGGISAGNTGAASYFGGLITGPSTASFESLRLASMGFGIGTAFAGGQSEIYTSSTNPLGIGTTGNAVFRIYTNSTLACTFSAAQAATFAGAVTANGQLIGKGTATNDSAAAGYIGEYASSTGGPVTLTNGVAANIASLVLSAGDWDVTYAGTFSGSITGTATTMSISATSATHNYATGSYTVSPTVPTVNSDLSHTVTERVSTTGATFYFVASMVFSAGTGTAGGKIHARRVR